MAELKDQLRALAKNLNTLSKQVDKLSKQAGKAAPVKKAAAKKAKAVKKTAGAKKAAPKAAKKTVKGGATVLDNVMDAVKRSRKGITIAQLKEKTGLSPRQLSNALYKLSKKGTIKSMSRGIYTKA
jgi:predicted Rossmann fold nucleotide-binding protein DprA/Smf involved in DNA uptake